MASGVKCAEDCVPKFQKMKIEKVYKYLIFKIEDKKVIKIEKEGLSEELKESTSEEIFEKLKTEFPPDDCRFAIYDCPITAKSGMENNKLIFIHWNCDDAKVQSKMLYASSKEAIRSATKQGVDNEYQATDLGELDFKEVRKKAGSCE